MKVFISVDLEGISGIVQWDVADRQMERELITAEVNAAIAGAFEGGATQILVTEAHGNMRNIIPEKIDFRARFLSGQSKPMNHMSGIDSTFKAVFLIGYHSKAGTLKGVMAHTYTGSIFSLEINGRSLGEVGLDAAIAGYYDVPVVLLTGDKAAYEEARELIVGIETVAVKEGISRLATICLQPSHARKLIEEAAKRAVKRAISSQEVKHLMIEKPVHVKVTFIDPSYADGVANLPSVERVDGRTIAFRSSDFIQAFEFFNSIQFLAGIVK
ncbi:MAG: M55 family metallopeptidase [Thermoproteota archaeon]